MSGNGRMGAMVFGDPQHETVIANHCRLFLPLGSRERVPDLAEHVPELRRMIRRDGYKKAMDFFLERANEQGFPGLIWTDPFHPGFELKIDTGPGGPPDGKGEYVRTQDFSTGEVRVIWRAGAREIRRRLFVSRTHNAIVLAIPHRAEHLVVHGFALQKDGHEAIVQSNDVGAIGLQLIAGLLDPVEGLAPVPQGQRPEVGR